MERPKGELGRKIDEAEEIRHASDYDLDKREEAGIDCFVYAQI